MWGGMGGVMKVIGARSKDQSSGKKREKKWEPTGLGGKIHLLETEKLKGSKKIHQFPREKKKWQKRNPKGGGVQCKPNTS